MFFSPTMGTYQRRKRRQKRITQVKTNSPMKILFLGLFSNVLLYESGFQIKILMSWLAPTRKYSNKFWDLPPLLFAETPSFREASPLPEGEVQVPVFY